MNTLQIDSEIIVPSVDESEKDKPFNLSNMRLLFNMALKFLEDFEPTSPGYDIFFNSVGRLSKASRTMAESMRGKEEENNVYVLLHIYLVETEIANKFLEICAKDSRIQVKRDSNFVYLRIDKEIEEETVKLARKHQYNVFEGTLEVSPFWEEPKTA